VDRADEMERIVKLVDRELGEVVFPFSDEVRYREGLHGDDQEALGLSSARSRRPAMRSMT
jgi:hypothetical protein